ncbi:hypothetical protein V2J09_002222 [Rumex salicifolius]
MTDSEQDLDFDLNQVPEPEVDCSICLNPVDIEEPRGYAKLQCGHEFHLDCIGSTFNVRGFMKCPNCRDQEWSDWLYSVSTGDSRTDVDLVNWISDHHPFFVVPDGYHLCPGRGFVGANNVPVKGHIIYGMSSQDDFEVQMPPPRRIQIVADRASPETVRRSNNMNESDDQEGSLSVNGTNAIRRIYGSTHQPTFNCGDATCAARNPSTADTLFSGHTVSASSTQRVSIFNTMLTEPQPSVMPSARGIQVPYDFNQAGAMSSPFDPAVRRALAELAPPDGSPIITSCGNSHLKLTGVPIYNPQDEDIPMPNNPPAPPQGNGPHLYCMMDLPNAGSTG